MSRSISHTRNFASRLMAYEAGRNKSSESKIPPALQICKNLQPHLATLMGSGGYRALLTRALALAAAEDPSLRAVRVTADGSLAGLEELQSEAGPDESFEGGVVLLAQVFGLLVAFIGEDLTLRLVREIWAKVPPDDLEFSKEAKNEKTK